MKKQFIVTIDMKKNAVAPTERKIEGAVWSTCQKAEEYKDVNATELPSNSVGVILWCEVCALAQKFDKKWKIMNVFDSERKAKNALDRAIKNYTNTNLHGEFAALRYSEVSKCWRLIESKEC